MLSISRAARWIATGLGAAFVALAFASIGHAESCTVSASEDLCRGDDGSSSSPDGESVQARDFDLSGGIGAIIDQGGEGAQSTTGGNGGNGGSVLGTAHLRLEIGESLYNVGAKAVVVVSQGGDGGSGEEGGGGGAGGDIEANISGGDNGGLFIRSQGGTGDGGVISGEGGRAGNITASVAGNFGTVFVVSQGGYSIGGKPGDGGDLNLEFSGAASYLEAISQGGTSTGAVDALGTGGDISVVLRGEVAGDVDLRSQTFACSSACPINPGGQVLVRLADGASVGGTIGSDSAAHSTLEFAFTATSQTEADTFGAALVGQGATGSVMFQGKTYSWRGFGQLSNLVTVLQAMAPDSPIAVSTSGGMSANVRVASESTSSGSPTKLHCTSSKVIALQRDGRVQLNVKPIGEKRFVLGWLITGAGFVPAVDSDWAVVIGAEGFAVTMPDGTTAAECSFA